MKSKHWLLLGGGTLAVLAILGVVFAIAWKLTEPEVATGLPMVAINSPASGSQVQVGQEVTVQMTATDAVGVTRIELLVNGVLYGSEASPIPQGQSPFISRQSWRASTPGTYTLIAKGYNAAGGVSQPTVITVQVVAEATATPTVMVTPVPGEPTITPTNTPTPREPTPIVIVITPIPGKVTDTPTPTPTSSPTVQKCQVPNITGLTVSDAISQIFAARLFPRLSPVGEGEPLIQSPNAGVMAVCGSNVDVPYHRPKDEWGCPSWLYRLGEGEWSMMVGRRYWPEDWLQPWLMDWIKKNSPHIVDLNRVKAGDVLCMPPLPYGSQQVIHVQRGIVRLDGQPVEGAAVHIRTSKGKEPVAGTDRLGRYWLTWVDLWDPPVKGDAYLRDLHEAVQIEPSGGDFMDDRIARLAEVNFDLTSKPVYHRSITVFLTDGPIGMPLPGTAWCSYEDPREFPSTAVTITIPLPSGKGLGAIPMTPMQSTLPIQCYVEAAEAASYYSEMATAEVEEDSFTLHVHLYPIPPDQESLRDEWAVRFVATRLGAGQVNVIPFTGCVRMFEHGWLGWSKFVGTPPTTPGLIRIYYANGDSEEGWLDTWDQQAAMPTVPGNPPQGKCQPNKGIGWCWANYGTVSSKLGWSIECAQPCQGKVCNGEVCDTQDFNSFAAAGDRGLLYYCRFPMRVFGSYSSPEGWKYAVYDLRRP